jgi:hypothetical protein
MARAVRGEAGHLGAEYDAGKEMAFSTEHPDAKRAIL